MVSNEDTFPSRHIMSEWRLSMSTRHNVSTSIWRHLDVMCLLRMVERNKQLYPHYVWPWHRNVTFWYNVQQHMFWSSCNNVHPDFVLSICRMQTYKCTVNLNQNYKYTAYTSFMEKRPKVQAFRKHHFKGWTNNNIYTCIVPALEGIKLFHAQFNWAYNFKCVLRPVYLQTLLL